MNRPVPIVVASLVIAGGALLLASTAFSGPHAFSNRPLTGWASVPVLCVCGLGLIAYGAWLLRRMR